MLLPKLADSITSKLLRRTGCPSDKKVKDQSSLKMVQADKMV